MIDILIAALPGILGVLGQLLAAFLANWKIVVPATGAATITAVQGYVSSAGVNPLLKTGDDKWQWVFDRMEEWALAENVAFDKALVNTLIELGVQHHRATAAK